jgi:hypothetical protein
MAIDLNLQPVMTSTPYDQYTSGGNFDINAAVSSGLLQNPPASSSGFFGDLLGGVGDYFTSPQGSSLANFGALAALNEYQRSQLRDIGREAQTRAEGLGTRAAEASKFVPFTVTGTTGAQATTTPEGGVSVGLSPQEQALQNYLFGGAGQFLQQARAPIAQTEQDIFNRLNAIADPERQRQQLALEERLAAQGRLGTSSAAYGGATPEQLALATAQEQQRSQMALQARQQALAEQQQAAGLGQGMLTSAYVPQAQQLNVLGAATPIAGYADIGRRYGANLQAEAGMTGLDALLQTELGRANLTSNYTNALANLIAQQQAAQAAQQGQAGTTDLLGGLINTGLSKVGGFFDSLFGG